MESKKGKMCMVYFSSMLKAKGLRIRIYLPIMAYDDSEMQFYFFYV